MNRAEQKKLRAEILAGKAYCGIPKAFQDKIADGDEFTIKGIKMNPDGTFQTKCAEGQETVFTARHEQ